MVITVSGHQMPYVINAPPTQQREYEKGSRASLSRCIATISLAEVIQTGIVKMFGMSS